MKFNLHIAWHIETKAMNVYISRNNKIIHINSGYGIKMRDYSHKNSTISKDISKFPFLRDIYEIV